jgi:hypothetical protein
MGIYKTFICSVCGLAFCGNVFHESHQDANFIVRPLATKPALDAIIFQGPRHGNEPEAPGGPLNAAWATVAVTTSASTAAAPIFLGFPKSS